MRLLAVLFFAISIKSIAQSPAVPQILRSQMTLDELSSKPILNSATLYGIPMRPPELIGNFYIDENWNKTTVLLYENERLIEGYKTRYDLKNKLLEVKVELNVKGLDVAKIKSLVWMDTVFSRPRYFVNAKEYSIDGVKLDGLLEVLVDGKLPLFSFTTVTIKKADYNVALDVGSRDDKVFKRETYYYGINNKLFEYKGRKQVSQAFGEKLPQIESFVKANNLSYSKEFDMIKIFDYYNSLPE